MPPRPTLPGRPLGRPSLRPGRPTYVDSEWSDDSLYGAMQAVLHERGVWQRVQGLERSDLEGRSDDDIAATLIGSLFRPATLADERPVVQEPVDGDSDYDNGRQIISAQFVISWRIEGPSEWLTNWPWKADDQPRDPIGIAGDESRNSDLDEHFLMNPFSVEPGWVHSWFEVYEDQTPHTEVRDQRIAARTSYLTVFLDSHAQAVGVCASRLQEIVTSSITERRRRLDFTHAVIAGLELNPAPLPLPELADGAGIEMALPAPTLAPAGFENIILAIEGWRTKIQDGVRYMHDLSENRLSYTLLVALEARFGLADHGVFVHSGAADITIPARRLARLADLHLENDEDDVFAAESKKGTGSSLATYAKDQVDRYLHRNTYHACLVLFVTSDRFVEAEQQILTTLRAHDYFDNDSESIGTIPVFVFNDNLAGIRRRIAIVVVTLPRVNDQQDERGRRAAADARTESR